LLASGCVVAPVRYHYPRLAGNVDGAVDRLELTVGCAEDEGRAGPPHEEARLAVERTRLALSQDPIDEPVMGAALDEAARHLDGVAEAARAALARVAPAPAPEGRDERLFDPWGDRDRYFDLENQARVAAREVRALRRSVAGTPPGGE
jgi:hypothetical protein